jgi:hypothetical protein
MVMLTVIQVGMWKTTSHANLTESDLLATVMTRIRHGVDVQGAALGIWSRAVRMRMARTGCPRSRATGRSTPFLRHENRQREMLNVPVRTESHVGISGEGYLAPARICDPILRKERSVAT